MVFPSKIKIFVCDTWKWWKQGWEATVGELLVCVVGTSYCAVQIPDYVESSPRTGQVHDLVSPNLVLIFRRTNISFILNFSRLQ